MSLNVLTQGGGAGGEFASIFVTGLDESSTVTATKDGKTVQGRWLSAEESGRFAGGHPECIKSDADYLLYTYGTRNYKKAYAGDAYACTVVVGGWLFALMVSKTASAVAIYTDGDHSSGVMESNLTVAFRGETWYVSGDGAAFQATAPTTSNVIHFGTFATREEAALAFLEYVTPKPAEGFEIAKLKEYGLWTVTATNGEKIATQDVLVDAAVTFEIEMSYKLWLYREGEEFEDVTGGWSADGWAFAEYTNQKKEVKNADSISVDFSSSSGLSLFGTQNAIDTTGYSKACCLFDCAAVGTYGWGLGLIGEYSKTTSAHSGASFGGSSFATGSGIVPEFDISGATQPLYFALESCAGAKWTAKEIWLE